MTNLHKKVEEALKLNRDIVCDESQINDKQPFTEEYFEFLGLSRNDLKKLERHGLAVRRYSKNQYLPGETLPNGKIVPENTVYKGNGRRVAWILIARKEG